MGGQGVLNRTLDVSRITWAKLQPFIDQVAAHVAAGTPMTPEERAYVESLHPTTDKWNYTCYDHQRYYFDGKFSLERVDEQPGTLIRVWWSLLRRDPLVNLEHMRCSSALIWRISTGDSYLSAYGMWRDSQGALHTIEPNAHGLAWSPVLPSLAHPLKDLLEWTEARERVWFVWRPAIYLLLTLAGAAVVAIRARSKRFLLLAAPVVFHSALMLGITPNQDFRFQYGVYLVALLFGATFLLGRLPCESGASGRGQEEGSREGETAPGEPMPPEEPWRAAGVGG
jgi:hypothetical protein